MFEVRIGMHLHLKVINDQLARLGYKAELSKGSGYFFFRGGETTNWIDRSVAVRTINSLTLKEWIAEFRRLKALNQQILKTVEKGAVKNT
jgi:hypothetical protein